MRGSITNVSRIFMDKSSVHRLVQYWSNNGSVGNEKVRLLNAHRPHMQHHTNGRKGLGHIS